MVLINVGGQVISARLGSRDRPPLGAPLSVSVDTSAVNLFDPETGSRI
jgi:multiple sugar transport system ATP-binding protein